MDPSANALEEIGRLRRTMRDLVAISTLPAVWIGLGAEGIARSLADVLLHALSLDLIYVRIGSLASEGTVEVLRSKNDPDSADVESLREAITTLLEADPSNSSVTIPEPLGQGVLNIAVTRFGIGDDHGVLVAGSRSPGFPTEQDRVLLGVGANQTAIVVQRRRAEERLQEQQEWLRVTLASIGDAVIATDNEGRVTFLNSVAEELTGWTAGDAQNKPLESVFAVLNKQTGRPVENPVGRVLREGASVGPARHTVLIAKDGTERPIDDSAAPIRDAAGAMLGVVLIFRDVTEQRRAEQEVRASEARKSAILETALDCIITLNHEGKVLEFNPAAEKTFGYPRTEIVGREITDLLVPSPLWQPHGDSPASTFASGADLVVGQRLELSALHADGSEFPVELAITRIPTEGPPLFTAYLRDITERKRVEQNRSVRLAVTHLLTQASNVREAASGVLQAVCENLGWDVGFFWTVDEQKSSLLCQHSWHKAGVPVTEFETASCNCSFTPGDGLPGSVWATGEPAWLLDVTKDATFPRAASAAKEGLHSAFACPVLVGDRVFGVVEFFTKRIREADLDLLEMMASMAGAVGQFIERTQTEQDLRLQARVLESMGEGVSLLDDNGVIVYTNPAEDRIFGYKPGELLGQHVSVQNCPTEEGQPVVDEVLEWLKTEGAWSGEFQNHRKDGSLLTTYAHITALETGGRRYFVCVQEDITERNRVSTELQDARSRLEAALEAGAIATWTWDIPSNRLFTDRNLAKLFNLEPSDADGGLVDVYIHSIHPDDQGKVTRALQRSIQNAEDYEADYRIIQPDGSVRWVAAHGRAQRDESGRALRMPGVLVDITDRKQLEEELRLRVKQLAEADRHKAELLGSLRESEEKLRLLADTIPQLAWMARPDGHIFWYNRQWYEYTGKTLEQMQGWGWQSVHDPDVLSKVLERWKGAIASGEPFEMVFPLKDADGEFRPFLTRVNPLRDESGCILYWFGTNTDISEIKRMEEALRDGDRRKDEFLATLAHELRNPLAPIRTGLELMKLAKDDPATMEETRLTMERQTQQLIALVDDLLDVSRITRGRLELRKCRVELSDVLQSAVEASRPFIDEARHLLTIVVPELPVYLYADPHRLAQVVSNLLNNAAKYTPEGGRIRLAAERHGDDVILAVRDNGIGIPSEMLYRIFEMFAQIDRSMERTYTGLGIGLTLVKSLVEMHGGSIDVQSDGRDRGSEFRVRLPILAETPAEDVKPVQPHVNSSTSRKRRVLVVDDNKPAADILSMVVRMLGNEVRTACDGQQGIEVAAEFLPNVVLMDLGMPKLNGYEAARHIRQQPWGQKMVLVALTGWGQEEDKQRTKEAGFDHHLVKPAEPAELQKLFAMAEEQDS